ncbi:copper homeostasis protein CutC [Flavobacterium sp. MAH-1]|uniref:PF03932 family protein CutC n=1 Tax=Flavobacterium agri TaxID=2743471 RepID=A0A7Y8Y4V5_9FLAO|nr:copper homeostasis protein CutC [Flavobacterium agri]NUY82570.1 copper homeostasis protein CutC [Flavobacterium agri]NYA72593.1 copper homeostasis protein CutC [Flavobacterium agri]
MKLEIACFNYESAIVAARSGADRIELCAGFEVGGTTPDFEILKKLKAEIELPIYVMIRPRGGNFVYSDSEFNQMKSEIEKFGSLADGFVFGILDSGSKVDVERNSELVQLTGKPCTFHRAFDEVDDFDSALEDVILCGFSNILTSAGKGNAIDNFGKLSDLVRKSDGKITVMPGGGVRSSNIEKLKTSGANWFHSAAITDGNQSVDANETKKLKL